MKKIVALSLASLSFVTAASAVAQEQLVVPFNQPDGAVTNGLYAGQVRITVAGTGFSFGETENDAFYLLPDGTLSPGETGYYQLGFGTSTLTEFDQNNAAYLSIPTGRPAFNPLNTYTFLLNTGLTTPGQLHFGVTDGQFIDNAGAFTLNIAAVPEPATWAMMTLGFGMVGFGLRRRNNITTKVSFA